MKAKLAFQTIFASIFAAILYGIIHDQITIRICPEYFTIWHPPIYPPDNLTMLALVWGVVATWWMGAILGGVLAAFAVLGKAPAASFQQVAGSIAFILLCSASAAILAGLVVWSLRFEAPPFVMREAIYFAGPELRQKFTIALAIHEASYDVSAIAAIIAGLRLVKARKSQIQASSH